MTTFSETVAARGATANRLTVVYLAVFVMSWTVLPLLIGRVPPTDNFEQLRWSAAFEWGYAKHPPFPTWELIAAGSVFPKGLPLTYALGALQVAAMLALAWKLARDTLGEARARVAVLLVTCIFFYSRRLHFFNHNTVLLSAYAASAWCAYRALATPGLAWWVALGVAWGIGMLSKYQMVVGIASSIAFIAASSERPWRERIGGITVAGVVALLLFAPHGFWMVGDRFSTVGYAMRWIDDARSPLVRLLDVLGFLGAQLGRLAPALIAFGVLLGIARRGSAEPHGASAGPGQAGDALARRALTLHAWGPFAAMALLSLAVGLDLGVPWGTAFLWALPLWLLSRGPGETLARMKPAHVLLTIIVIQGLLVATYR